MSNSEIVRTLRLKQIAPESVLWKSLLTALLSKRDGQEMAVHVGYPPKYNGPEPVNMRFEKIDPETGRVHFSLPLDHIIGIDDDLY